MKNDKKISALGVTSTQGGHTGENEFAPILASFPPSCQVKSAGEVEGIKRYIAKSRVPSNPRYDAKFSDILALERELGGLMALELAFRYGVAKGYRAAKAEGR